MLIDEYDAPIQAGFTYNYYKDVIDFMRGILGAGLKDNSSLNFAIMTGILRVALLCSSPSACSYEGQAKESIFSGLNNLRACSLLNNAYADKFGLLEDEVIEFMHHYKFNISVAALSPQ